MTNGEKIQQDFVCDVLVEDKFIYVIFPDENIGASRFDLNWWNAEYAEPKTGYWIGYYEDARGYKYRCSECGKEQLIDTKFCWECGARMSEVSK